MENKICYIVEAIRWGDREDHSYPLGVYSSLERAKSAADEHAQYRGGKYTCVVHQCALDEQLDTDWNASTLYQTTPPYEIDSDSLRVRNILFSMSKNSKINNT